MNVYVTVLIIYNLVIQKQNITFFNKQIPTNSPFYSALNVADRPL